MAKNLSQENLSVKAPYISFVWAEDTERLIGRDNDLPWHLPGEMKHFVEVTTGDVVVMGRKTYEGIPNPPLKNRLNIVMTRNPDFKAEGVVVCHNKEEVLNYLEQEQIEKPIHVIGGTTLFELFSEEVSVLYRTIIHEVFEGDTYMPEINYRDFRCVDSADGVLDHKNKYPHRFYLYERKKPVDLFN